MSIADKIYFLLLLLTLACYLSKLASKEEYVKWITILLVFWLLTVLPGVLLVAYANKSNVFIYHIIVPVEFAFFMLMFRDYFDSPTAKRNVTYLIPSFILLCIFFSMFIQKPNINNTYAVIIESMILIIVSLFFLRETALLRRVKVMHRHPMFWISTGVLFCCCCNLVVEGMLNYLIARSNDLAVQLYKIIYFGNYVLFCFLILGLYCDKIFISGSKQKIL